MSVPKNQKINEESVTVIVSRKVKSGKEKEFKEWAAGISLDAEKFEGYIGTRNIQPSSLTNSDYVVIIKFNNYINLKKWENSTIRKIWIKKAGEFTEGNVKVQKLTGLEYWFALPDTNLKTPPPRYKMAIVTFLALFPTINIVSFILNPLLNTLQVTLNMALNVMLTIILMTYIIMPVMTRIFAFWLFKSHK